MPEQRIEFQGTVHSFPDTFTKQQIQYALQNYKEPPKAADEKRGLLDSIGDYMPSARTTLTLGGSAIGGMAGVAAGGIGAAPGMVLGGLTGEALSQLAERFTGSPDAPQTAGNAVGRLADEATGTLSGIVGGEVVGRALPIAGKAFQAVRGAASRSTRKLPSIFRTSETMATRALTPEDVHFQSKLPTALNEIKAAEGKIGPMRSYEKVLQGSEISTRGLNDSLNKLIEPQAAVTIPGSGTIMRKAQIAAIPDTIRLTRPDQYKLITAKIMAEPEKDFTLGELNDIRVSGNKMLDPKYGKVVTKQLSTDEQLSTAIEKAKTDSAREQMYSGMDRHGLGGGTEAREIGRRMGATMEFQSEVEKKANTMVSQRIPTIEQPMEGIRRGIRDINPFRSMPIKPPVENDLLTAVRRWSGKSKPVRADLRRPLGPTRLLDAGIRLPEGTESPSGGGSVTGSFAHAQPGTREMRTGRLLGAGNVTKEGIPLFEMPAYSGGDIRGATEYPTLDNSSAVKPREVMGENYPRSADELKIEEVKRLIKNKKK